MKEDLASRVRGYHLAGARKPLSQAGRPIVPCFPLSQPQQEAARVPQIKNRNKASPPFGLFLPDGISSAGKGKVENVNQSGILTTS